MRVIKIMRYRIMETVEQIAEAGNTTPAEIIKSFWIGIIASPFVIASVYGMFALLMMMDGGLR